MKTLVVNFYGGPGAGKSTMANRVFSEIKDLGMNVEVATEYAKDLTWQESFGVLSDQLYVFAKQQHRIWRLNNKVQIILTDSPLLNSLVYGKETTTPEFKAMVIAEYKRYECFDIYLNRVKPYNPVGRNQTEEQAIQLDHDIRDVVQKLDGFDEYVDGCKSSTDKVVELVLKQYNLINQ